MSTRFKPTFKAPSLLQFKATETNRSLATFNLQAKATEVVNHGLAYRRRCVFYKTNQFGEFDWPIYFISGPDVGGAQLYLEVKLVLGPSTTDVAGTPDPHVYLTLNGSQSDILYQPDVDIVSSAVLRDSPDKLAPYSFRVPISPDTAYQGEVTIAGYTLAESIVIYEVVQPQIDSLAANALDRTKVGYGREVIDDDLYRPFETMHNLEKHGCSSLFYFSNPGGPTAAGYWYTTSTSYTNVVDQSSTSVSTSTPGYWLPLKYRKRQSKDTVPVKGYLYVDVPAGETMYVRLATSAGAVSGSEVTTSSDGWQEFTCNLPADDASLDSDGYLKVDVQAKISGGSQGDIDTFYLFQYEA